MGESFYSRTWASLLAFSLWLYEWLRAETSDTVIRSGLRFKAQTDHSPVMDEVPWGNKD